jgi:hypothetical protein
MKLLGFLPCKYQPKTTMTLSIKQLKESQNAQN